MEQGPYRLVAKAMKELVHRAFGEKNGIGVKVSERSGFQFGVVSLIDSETRPSQPNIVRLSESKSFQGIQVRAQSRDEAPCAFLKFQSALCLSNRKRQSV